jgi:hypothetical protein
MPTVHEVLKASGMTDDQIASLDSKVTTSLKGFLDTAENEKKIGTDALAKAELEKQTAAAELTKAQQAFEAAKAAKDQAEAERLGNVRFYEEKITPALTGWEQAKKDLEIKKANAEAKAAFLETQIAGAREAGFLPADAPAFVLPNSTTPPDPQRDSSGRFVPGGANGTPGSPTFMSPEQMAAQAGNALSMIADAQFEYQRLYGAPMPMLPSQLVAEAEKFRLDPKTFAEKQFKFSEKRQEIADKSRADEHARIAAEAVKPFQDQMAAKEKEFQDKLAAQSREFAERSASNPDVRIPQASRFSELTRAVRSNERPDPLNLNTEQRRMATRTAIHSEVAEPV